MGFGGILIVILLFGTKRLRGMGSDLGAALKNFKKSVKDGENQTTSSDEPSQIDNQAQGSVIEGEATKKEKDNA